MDIAPGVTFSPSEPSAHVETWDEGDFQLFKFVNINKTVPHGALRVPVFKDLSSNGSHSNYFVEGTLWTLYSME